MKVSECDLAYAAGLFDGEGTVTLSKHQATDKFRCPTLSMSSTTLSLLEFMRDVFGGSISFHKTYKSHHKSSYSWKVRNDSALSIAQALQPYIKEPEKRRRIDLLVSQYKIVTSRNGKYSEELLARKLDFEQTFFHPSTPLP